MGTKTADPTNAHGLPRKVNPPELVVTLGRSTPRCEQDTMGKGAKGKGNAVETAPSDEEGVENGDRPTLHPKICVLLPDQIPEIHPTRDRRQRRGASVVQDVQETYYYKNQKRSGEIVKSPQLRGAKAVKFEAAHGQFLSSEKPQENTPLPSRPGKPNSKRSPSLKNAQSCHASPNFPASPRRHTTQQPTDQSTVIVVHTHISTRI
ncbi:hypothetical protein HYDPIDRAFT_120367 [Hydnomerulius pinastri MD-312]|uniref:Uncharacterized protein n=1 Tax=Hydnomerulius pinastri MD-312 TaxID=994086 RepID=A0A0C9W5E8_9AGAM|nr:hypothetical protein HYDPIDRAFT_120367 [Hydnomerulius pinastri MD-312]